MLTDRSWCVTLTGVTGSPAAHHADAVVDLGFADERSVVQTRFARILPV
ncbi:hypothetical protein [Streptomyces sp. NPDC051909]